MARNNRVSDNNLLRKGLLEIQRRLPFGWRVASTSGGRTVEVTAPDHRSGELALEARSRIVPKDVLALADKLESVTAPVVVSSYLTQSTRDRLRDNGFCYLDLTGNARIVLNEPGLYIETQGATENPNPEERSARSLRGPKAGRVVRALIEMKTPPGVRELAALTEIDPGYVSRVLSFLDSEALIIRRERGRIERVDWPSLLQRWALEVPLDERGRIQTFLEPRGLSVLLSRLAKTDLPYAITGSLAAATLAPFAPTRLATLWVSDLDAAATNLALRPADAGANVMLCEATNETVFQGVVQRKSLWYAAPTQIAIDLLTSPGRGPQEGAEFIDWMRENEGGWRR